MCYREMIKLPGSFFEICKNDTNENIQCLSLQNDSDFFLIAKKYILFPF